MNLSDIKITLYNYFSQNDQILWPEDRLKIIPISETPELHYAAVLEALNEFESAGLIKKIEYKEGSSKTGKVAWILINNLRTLNQTIVLPGDLCGAIADTLNQLNPNKETGNISNPLALSSLEIETLLSLVEQWIKNQSAELLEKLKDQ